MENGNGQASVQGLINTPFGYQPYQPQDISAATQGTGPVIAEGDIALPVESVATKPDRSWMRTPEGKAKMSAAMKAGWAKKRLAAARRAARIAAAEREVASTARGAGIDKAIEYHRNALNTLLAAKSLLK